MWSCVFQEINTGVSSPCQLSTVHDSAMPLSHRQAMQQQELGAMNGAWSMQPAIPGSQLVLSPHELKPAACRAAGRRAEQAPTVPDPPREPPRGPVGALRGWLGQRGPPPGALTSSDRVMYGISAISSRADHAMPSLRLLWVAARGRPPHHLVLGAADLLLQVPADDPLRGGAAPAMCRSGGRAGF